MAAKQHETRKYPKADYRLRPNLSPPCWHAHTAIKRTPRFSQAASRDSAAELGRERSIRPTQARPPSPAPMWIGDAAQLRRGLEPMWLRSPCRLVCNGRTSNWPRNARSVATPVSFESSSHSISLMPPESWRRCGLGPGQAWTGAPWRAARPCRGSSGGTGSKTPRSCDTKQNNQNNNAACDKHTQRDGRRWRTTCGGGARGMHRSDTADRSGHAKRRAAVGTHQSGLSVLKRIVVVRLRLP